MAATTPQYQVRALERALQILDVFSLERSQLSLSDIASATDLSPSTALRLLSTLSQYGYIERSPDTDRFRLGVAMFERGSIYIQSTNLEAEAIEPLEQLAQRTNHTASVAILDRGEIVHIAVVQPDRPIRYYAPVGQREAAHCTGLGKVLLAGLSEAEFDALMPSLDLAARTTHTITTADDLKAHCRVVRERGFAIDNEESLIGLRCVAAQIHDDRNRQVAAISASGASNEFEEDALPELIAAVQDAAKEVSVRLGSHDRPSFPV